MVLYKNVPLGICSPIFFNCKSRFTVFKCVLHCRNCGVCVYCSCSNTWNKVMIPETYNIKNERTIKACNTCYNLATVFQNSLLQANFDDALTIYRNRNRNSIYYFRVYAELL